MATAEEKLRVMHAAGVIEPSDSPWLFPVVLVRKKEDSWRFCVDYWCLNSVTRKDSHPLPRIGEALDYVAGSQWFSSLNRRSGYWQVDLTPGAQVKMVFSIGQGLWQLWCVLFGLCNTLSILKCLMKKVLVDIPYSQCVIYLDDLLVHSGTFNGALANLCEVFSAIQRVNPTPKSATCFGVRLCFWDI